MSSEQPPSVPSVLQSGKSNLSPPGGGRGTARAVLALLCVLFIAAGVRYLNFPHRDEVRDMDETGYLSGGLVMWEGMTPGIRVAPAGLETWATWLYAGYRSTRATLNPEPAIAAAPVQLRPYLAIDSVLFDIYQDMSGLHRVQLILQFIIALGGVYGAFGLGRLYGGTPCGILLGGIVALLPLYVDYAAMSRPYSDAWSLSFLAIYSAAAVTGARRWIQTGLFLGLAISSRIEMLGIVPIVLWQFWENPEAGRTCRSLMKSCLLAAVLLLVLAPWLIFQTVGVLRTIATTRLMTWADNPHPRLTTLQDLTWGEGLAPLLLLTLIAVIFVPTGKRLRSWLLTLYVLILIGSMFAGPYQPMRYHGAPIVAILALAGISAAHVARPWPGLVPVLLLIVLALPAVQTGRYLAQRHSQWAADEATAWVEQHVPAGTRIYDDVAWDLRCPLPTAQSSDALWAEVSDAQSWRKKFERGLARLHASSSYMPRALTEDNMVLDRGLWRRYFILGNPARTGRPRYDLHIYHLSPAVYGVIDLPGDFAQHGGVVIWREGGGAPPELGTPVAKWTNASGDWGTYIFCSPDIKATLH